MAYIGVVGIAVIKEKYGEQFIFTSSVQFKFQNKADRKISLKKNTVY